VVLETGDSELVSLLVGLEPNERGRVDVRVSEGVVLPGGGRLVLVEPMLDGWTVGGALTGRRVPLGLPPARWEILRVRGGNVWFAGDVGLRRCEMSSARCEATGGLPPGPESQQVGPEAGFRVVLEEDGDVSLLLPHHEAGRGEIIASDIARVVSVRWLADAPDARVQEYLDRSFRGRASLEAAPLEVEVDGDLAEWGDPEPAVVDAPWQADVRDGWTGPADASFSVAAAYDGPDLCLAGRFRDDLLLPGDAVFVTIDGESTTLPVDGSDPGVAVVREWFGFHFETCFPMPGALADGRGAMVVGYRDADGQGLASTLVTSPQLGRWSVGRLRLLR
jgi:hypothetical protein